MSKTGEIFDKGVELLGRGDLSDAETCFRGALSRNPASMDARFQLGNLLLLDGRASEAIEQYRIILAGDPDCLQVLLNIGHAYRKCKRSDDAKASFEKIVSIDPIHQEALYHLAVLRLDSGPIDTAIDQLMVLTQLHPQFLDAWFELGMAYKISGQLDAAIVCFHRALKIEPKMAPIFNHLGIVHKQKGAFDLAQKCYNQALELDPNLFDVHNNLGTLFHETGQHEKAVASFKQALALNENYANACHNLGNALQSMARYEEAVTFYLKAIAIDPDFSSAYYHCGTAHQNLKNSKMAITMFEKTLSLRPNWAKAVCARYHQAQSVCDWQRMQELDPVIDQMTADALEGNQRPAEQPFLSVVRKQNPYENHAIARAWSRDLVRRSSASVARYGHYDQPLSGEPITIGYVTNRFRNAATGHLMRGLFAAHDRKKFRICSYVYGPDDGSQYRKQILAASDASVDISSMGYQAAADRIHDDGVNILVDLKGYTRNNRLSMFVHRPAPIQVSYLGFAGTSGSDFLDYIIVDRVIIDEDDASNYSENPVYMPHCYLVNDNTKTIFAQEWTRTDFGLPQKAFVFCAFNMPYKIESEVFEAWMVILKSVPNSVLWLLKGEPLYEQKIREEAIIRGVDASRILFAGKLPIEAHLSRIQLADLALDTLTYNGHTTTGDMLWAGIPVLTVRGNHFMSRVSASQLKAIGMEMLIAANPKQYTQLAIDLANNPDRLEALKTKLKRRLKSEPLFDTQRFCRNLEQAYQTMWTTYLAGRSPQPIHVKDYG